jgi:hypothetical protein
MVLVRAKDDIVPPGVGRREMRVHMCLLPGPWS